MKRVTRSASKREHEEIAPPAKLHVVDLMSGPQILSPMIQRRNRRKEMEERVLDGLNDNISLVPPPLIVDKKGKKGSTRKIASKSKPDEDDVEGGAKKPKRKRKAVDWEDIEKEEEESGRNVNGQLLADGLDLMANAKVDYRNPPPGVLGAGKGTVNGLPEYEFRSLWQKSILPNLDSKNPAPWLQDPAFPPDDLIPTILSVVASVSLGTAVDLKHIAEKGINLSYDPDAFTPLVMRLKKPKATALVFKSGKMVVTGTKSEVECKVATRRIGRIIQKLGYRVSVVGMVIQNISATCNLGFRVRVHLFGGDQLLTKHIGYHPELFTGVSIPLVKPKVKVMIFRTGAVLITGAKAERELFEALRIVYPFAKMYAN